MLEFTPFWPRFLAKAPCIYQHQRKTHPMKNLKVLMVKSLFRPFALLPLKYLQAIGSFLGRYILLLNKKRVRIVQANLRACFPAMSEKERRSMTLAIAVESGKWMMESAKVWFGKPQELSSLITDKNRELMDTAYKKNKGVVVVLPHFGNWEMINYCMAERYDCAAMYKPVKSKTGEAIILDRRSSLSGKLFQADSRGVRQAFKHLKKGGVLVILSDHLPSREAGVYAPFFGIPALTGKLTHKLIKYNSSEAILATILRKPKGEGFEIAFHSLEGMHTDNEVEAATQLNGAIEKAISIAPEQYQWVYTRFAKQAKGQKSIYR